MGEMAFEKGLKGQYGFARFLMGVEYRYFSGRFPCFKEKPKDKQRKKIIAFYRRFLTFLWTHYKAGTEPEDVIISQEIIAILSGEKIATTWGFSAESYLENFKREVFPGFEYSAYIPKVEARSVINFGFNKYDLDLASKILTALDTLNIEQRRAYFGNMHLIDVVTGKRLRRNRSSNFIKDDFQFLMDAAQLAAKKKQLTHAQEHLTMKILEYHNDSRMINHFTRLLNKNEEHFLDVHSEHYDINKAKPKKEQDAFFKNPTFVGLLLQMPTPAYKIAKKTARAIPAGYPHLAKLKRELRSAAFRGKHSLDLSNVQLALLAHILMLDNLDILLEELSEAGLKIWDFFIEKLQAVPVDKKALKGCLKTSVYSLCYGAGIKTMREPFEEILPQKGAYKLFRRFMAIPIIKEIKEARDVRLDKIALHYSDDSSFGTEEEYQKYRKKAQKKLKSDKIKYVKGFNEWRSSKCSKAARSSLACDAQELEQMIMSVVYDEAIRERESGRARWNILLYLSDGIIISFNDKDEARRRGIVNRLQKLVNERAENLYNEKDEYEPRIQIQTKLELEDI